MELANEAFLTFKFEHTLGQWKMAYLTHQMECFPDLVDLLQTSIKKRGHGGEKKKKTLEGDGPLRKKQNLAEHRLLYLE